MSQRVTKTRRLRVTIHIRLIISATVAVLFGFVHPSRAVAAPPSDDQRAFEYAIESWDLDAARLLSAAFASEADRELALATISHLEANYPAAVEHLQLLLALPEEEVPASTRASAELLLAMSSGAIEIFANGTTITDRSANFELVLADNKDSLLAPYFFAAMDQVRTSLGEELGVTPSWPVRFELLDDPADLSVLTTLSIDAVYTTGTVGICKYRRVMMVSPRTMLMGYAWLDTASHEYVHYLVTLRTKNRAPVWLQEGLAKLYETRWRDPNPAELEPAVAKLLHDALVADELVTLEQMYPSVALLPSQELAALAYAEVQTMLQLVWERGGSKAIGELMDRVAAGEDAKQALAAAWGGTFEQFYEVWKREMLTRSKRASGSKLKRHEFAEAGADASSDPDLFGDPFSELGGGVARQHARLGVLLQLRGHLDAAAMQYERARTTDPRARAHPKLARRLGEIYLQRGDAAGARPLLELALRAEPENPNLLAALGRAQLALNDRDAAIRSLNRAIAQNPFIPTLHCDLAEVATSAEDRARERALCRR